MSFNNSDHHNDDVLTLSSAYFLTIIAVVTTLANGILLATMVADPARQLRTPPMYLIANLAFADILTGVIVDTFYAICAIATYNDRSIPVAQDIGNFASYVCINAAMWTRVALVCERYLCIKKPFRYRALASTQRILALAALIWLYSTTFAIIGLNCFSFNAGYRLIVTYLNMGLPSFIIAILYTNMYYFLRRQRFNDILRFQPFQMSKRNQLITEAKQDKRMLNTVVLILFIIFTTFIPHAVVCHIDFICPTHDSLAYDAVNRFSMPLVYMNSGINPFIYAWRLSVFRRSMKLLFCKDREVHPAVAETRSMASVISRQRSDRSLIF